MLLVVSEKLQINSIPFNFFINFPSREIYLDNRLSMSLLVFLTVEPTIWEANLLTSLPLIMLDD